MNLLYTYHSSFQKKNHSIDLCLFSFNNKILKDFDKGMMIGMILIDHKKAFETIEHDLILI